MSTDSLVDGATDTHPTYRLIAGDCRIELTGTVEETHRGQVVVLIKPDGTIMVHDIAGYQPVAWLTRAESVTTDAEGRLITAVDGDTWLRIEVDHAVVDRELPGSPAGQPTDACPNCGGFLVHTRDALHCVSCHDQYGLPGDAVLIDERCSCGLPKMRVARGEEFELCVDRECDPLDARIAERFDGVWSCPDAGCDGTLRVIRRGGLLLGCDRYPDCERAFRFPAGELEGHCTCGLPRFRRDGESRCLDVTCDVGE